MAVTRTIYLPSKEDLKLYNRAKDIAAESSGSVSNYILMALEHYVNNEGKKFEYPLYVLHIGKSLKMKKKKFYGIYLTSELKKVENKEIEVQVYLTQKGNIIIYQRERCLETIYEQAHYEVFSSLDEIDDISDGLQLAAREKLDIIEAEYLDV